MSWDAVLTAPPPHTHTFHNLTTSILKILSWCIVEQALRRQRIAVPMLGVWTAQ